MFYFIAAIFAVGASLFVAETEADLICPVVVDAGVIFSAPAAPLPASA